ncbi:hypothetical protein CH380_03710 [Leptospira adleri]|uniref:Uncharacterized protein n=1 Tax=Leptospira adleri TaxID=2023186 RepID=A0A2M9YTI3_9LEPT|nr:hypothetical protein CH380_03710 [Leptospira adleri]
MSWKKSAIPLQDSGFRYASKTKTTDSILFFDLRPIRFYASDRAFEAESFVYSHFGIWFSIELDFAN